MYQASTGTDGMAEVLTGRPEPLVVYYHNITPREFLEPFDVAAGMVLERGRTELRVLVARAAKLMANSEFSAREIRAMTDMDVQVLPPYLPPGLDAPPAASHVSWLRRTKRGADLLFIGRVAPNKNHAALMRAFAAYRDTVDGDARLFVVGAFGPKPYINALMALRERLGSRGIVFTGSISDSHIAAHLQEADVFVCLSLHEGFGVPLVEAMRFGIPVVAYDAGAVGETLGGAGVLVRTLEVPMVAEVIHRVVTDDELKKRVIAGQECRLSELEGIDRDAAIAAAVREVMPE
jgi:glycosyltransferase involved in cell wall biosynthesis